MSLQEIATTASQVVTAPTKPAREPRISKRLAEAIRLIEEGNVKTVKAASERVLMNYTHLCEALKKPHIQAFIARKRAENISRGALRASSRIVELIDAESEHVGMHASRLLLEASGDLPRSTGGGVNVQINNNVQAGYVIDLTERVHTADEPSQLNRAQVIDNTGDR